MIRFETKYLLWVILLWMGCHLSISYGYSVRVMDDAHRVLMFTKPVQRIITLSPDATEVLFELHAGSMIYGTIEQSDYPAAAQRIKRIGYYTEVDEEQLLALRPDLVVAPMGIHTMLLAQKLQNWHIPVYIFDPHTFLEFNRDLQHLGQLTHHEYEANKVVHRFHTQLKKLETHSPLHVRVLYVLWTHPLISVGRNTMIHRVINLCGGQNVFEAVKVDYPMFDLESMVAQDPQLIILSDPSQGSFLKKYFTLFHKKPLMVLIPANELQRASLRIILGVEKVCHAIQQTH